MLAVTHLVLHQAHALHTGSACEVFPARVGTLTFLLKFPADRLRMRGQNGHTWHESSDSEKCLFQQSLQFLLLAELEAQLQHWQCAFTGQQIAVACSTHVHEARTCQ